jgi:hypothetical protein
LLSMLTNSSHKFAYLFIPSVQCLKRGASLMEMFPTDGCFIYTESIAPVKFADNAQNDEVLITSLTWIAFELVC